MKSRLGGLARRATYIDGLRKDGVPLLHLDAGDAFQQKYALYEKDKAQVEAAARLYLKTFADMGLHAYNLGDRDLALGLDRLKALEKKAKFPILSANLLKDGKPVFTPSTVVEVGGYRIGVIGVITTLFVNKTSLEQNSGLTIAEPAPIVKAEADALRAKGVKIIVALAHLNDREVETLAKAVPDLTAILGGQSNRRQPLLKSAGGVFLANGYMRGKNMSVLDLFVNGDSLKFVDRDKGAAMKRRQRTLEAQIQGRERSIEAAKKDPARAKSVDYLERNLVQLKTELQELELDLEDLAEPDPNASYVKWELKGMTTAYADHAKTAAAVKAYRDVYPDPTRKKKTPPPPRLAKPATRGPAAKTK